MPLSFVSAFACLISVNHCPVKLRESHCVDDAIVAQVFIPAPLLFWVPGLLLQSDHDSRFDIMQTSRSRPRIGE
jgi:hypothetical protein